MTKQFTTSDDAVLAYNDTGNGAALMMLHGGAQASEQFKYQVETLKNHFRVITVDMRGHGKSPVTEHGYRVSRFAKDIYELLAYLNIDNCILLGHSFGCSVIWNYIDLFGSHRLSKLILIDEPTMCIANPSWNQDTIAETGAIVNPQTIYEQLNAIENDENDEAIKNLVVNLTTNKISPQDKEMIIRNMQEIPREAIVKLYFNNMTQDWRDVIARITLPTLIIGAYNSIVNWRSQTWIHQQIKGSKLEIFDEGHFMFLENPNRFNQCLLKFLT